VLIGYVMADDIPITRITAMLIPIAVLSFLDTPRNGQIPRNFERTKLSTKITLNKIINISFIIFCR